jgi:hypothetical protein
MTFDDTFRSDLEVARSGLERLSTKLHFNQYKEFLP